jgi:hypothetical protein
MKPRFKSRFFAKSEVYFSVNMNRDFLRRGEEGLLGQDSNMKPTLLSVHPMKATKEGKWDLKWLTIAAES